MTRTEYRENCPHRKENVLINGNREWGCENSVSFRLHSILFPCDDDCDYMHKYVPEKREKKTMTKEDYPVAEDTKLYLPYDREGNVTEDKRIVIRMDEIRRKYKRCSVCKRWFLLDTFPLAKTPDGHSSVCPECGKSEIKNEKPMEDKEKEIIQKENEVKEQAVKQFALQEVPDTDLIREIQRRGWKGNLKVTLDFEFK